MFKLVKSWKKNGKRGERILILRKVTIEDVHQSSWIIICVPTGMRLYLSHQSDCLGVNYDILQGEMLSKGSKV